MQFSDVSALKKNVAANFGGNIWVGLMAVVLIPVYVKLMGIEAYGLVGFFATLQSIFAVLDLGLTTTLNREFARLSGDPNARGRMRDLLRTFEVIYWSIAVFNGATVILLSRVIAKHWVHPQHLPTATVQQAVLLMGLVITMQWPLALYSGGLNGLQWQVTLAAINSAAATLRSVGAVVVLWLVAPTVEVYFAWQVIASIANTLAVAVALWARLGRGRATFHFDALRAVWRFAAGMFAIAVVSTILTQMDKLVLSKVLTLEAFGYYMIGAAVAASLYRVTTPVFTALFPQLSRLAAAGDESRIAELYHKSCQAVSVVVLPAAVFIAVFAPEVLWLWSRSMAVSQRAHAITSLLVIGTAFHGLMTVPYALQLAYGWTRLALYNNTISVLLLAPTIYLLATHYGGVGAAMVWPIYTTITCFVVVLVMHRRLLRGHARQWVVSDVGVPFFAAAATAFAGRALLGDTSYLPLLVVKLFAIATTTQLATVAVTPLVRDAVRGFLLARVRPATFR